MGEFAEGTTLIRVPVSVRDKLAAMRQRSKLAWGGLGATETLGQVIKRLAEAPWPAKPAPKKTTSRGRGKVNNKARRRGRRHR